MWAQGQHSRPPSQRSSLHVKKVARSAEVPPTHAAAWRGEQSTRAPSHTTQAAPLTSPVSWGPHPHPPTHPSHPPIPGRSAVPTHHVVDGPQDLFHLAYLGLVLKKDGGIEVGNLCVCGGGCGGRHRRSENVGDEQHRCAQAFTLCVQRLATDAWAACDQATSSSSCWSCVCCSRPVSVASCVVPPTRPTDTSREGPCKPGCAVLAPDRPAAHDPSPFHL